MSTNELIKQMKDVNSASAKVGKQRHNSCMNMQHSKKLDYIFFQPKIKSHQALKEKNLVEFLNLEGVFQINLGAALKEY